MDAQMERFVPEKGKKLRCGYTTGTCAAAAAKAAAVMLLTGEAPKQASVVTPGGLSLSLEIVGALAGPQGMSCAVVKDAGDDPDVTHGLRICALVGRAAAGVRIDGGAGVGRVTRPGLACKPGEAAINPVPRAMIARALNEAAAEHGYTGGFDVVISAPGGEEVAKKTFNPRLGITGGISILGTSGIVEPMSEQAIVDTIRLEIDAKIAAGAKTLLVCPGNYGRDFALAQFGIDLGQGVKCSNFIGETLDYAVFKGVSRILLIGHAGKLVKLAAGVMNTHSRVADCRGEIVAAHAALAGASGDQVRRLLEASTTDAMDALLRGFGIRDAVWESVSEKIRFHIDQRTGGKCRTEAVVFTAQGGAVIATPGARELIGEIKGLEA